MPLTFEKSDLFCLMHLTTNTHKKIFLLPLTCSNSLNYYPLAAQVFVLHKVQITQILGCAHEESTFFFISCASCTTLRPGAVFVYVCVLIIVSVYSLFCRLLQQYLIPPQSALVYVSPSSDREWQAGRLTFDLPLSQSRSFKLEHLSLS